jgi:hypothetical protein
VRACASSQADLHQLLLSAARRYHNKPRSGFGVITKSQQALPSLAEASMPFFASPQSQFISRTGSLGAKPPMLRGMTQKLMGVDSSQKGLAETTSQPKRTRFDTKLPSSVSGSCKKFVHTNTMNLRHLTGKSTESLKRMPSVESKTGSAGVMASSSQPFAFLPRAPIRALKEAGRLVPVAPSHATNLSELRDAEVVQQLRAEANELFGAMRHSIDGSAMAMVSETMQEEARGGSTSTYANNRQKMLEALDEESSCIFAAAPVPASKQRRSIFLQSRHCGTAVERSASCCSEDSVSFAPNGCSERNSMRPAGGAPFSTQTV